MFVCVRIASAFVGLLVTQRSLYSNMITSPTPPPTLSLTTSQVYIMIVGSAVLLFTSLHSQPAVRPPPLSLLSNNQYYRSMSSVKTMVTGIKVWLITNLLVVPVTKLCFANLTLLTCCSPCSVHFLSNLSLFLSSCVMMMVIMITDQAASCSPSNSLQTFY